MMRHSDFCILIISHGRAGNIRTISSLQRSNYTGPWFIVVDNEDSQIEDYRRIYGNDRVAVFNKTEEAERLDIADNFTPRLGRRSTVYVRNASFRIAEELGYRHFMVLDDDYNFFRFIIDEHRQYSSKRILDMDAVLDICLDYFVNTPSISTVAWLQGGDLLGGRNSNSLTGIRRKAMNSFICAVDRPFSFLGRFNEDVNTYIMHGNRGKVMFSLMELGLCQASTQQTSGGMTEAYVENGTYTKSFYSVMHLPSAVSIHTMGERWRRIHHRIDWNACVPKIIRQEYRKDDCQDSSPNGRSRRRR